MSTLKPTPGKHLAIQSVGSIGIHAEDGTRLATVKRMDDAVLFAAAGDLLEALEQVTAILDMVLQVNLLGIPADADGPAVVARAAIAKARGVTQ